MDGTLYLGEKPFEGAIRFLKALHERGRKRLFLTNNSAKSVRQCCQRLQRMGIPAIPEEILTSAVATIQYLQAHTKIRRLFVLAPPDVQREFIDGGFEITEDQPDAVVVGFDTTLTYDRAKAACHWILRGAAFVATHPDLVCPTEDLAVPDCGSITRMIAAASNAEPKVIGKPHTEMIQSALERLDAGPDTTAIVGDRLYTDMEMGYKAGLTTVLVLSGEASRADLSGLSRQPDYVVDSVAELIDRL
jgi:HAD superfamily hydrolase (TIGR01450 family)